MKFALTKKYYLNIHISNVYVYMYTGHWHNGLSVRQWPGRPGFNRQSSHTKDFKNGT